MIRLWNKATQNIKNKIKMGIVSIYSVVLWYSAYQILLYFPKKKTHV